MTKATGNKDAKESVVAKAQEFDMYYLNFNSMSLVISTVQSVNLDVLLIVPRLTNFA